MKKRRCKMEGCLVETGAPRGFCPTHVIKNKRCVEESCENWCAVFNRHGYCREHYAVAMYKARERWLS